jgi:hypothetical protein
MLFPDPVVAVLWLQRLWSAFLNGHFRHNISLSCLIQFLRTPYPHANTKKAETISDGRLNEEWWSSGSEARNGDTD